MNGGDGGEGFGQQVLKRVVAEPVQAIIAAAVAFGVAYVTNLWLMAVKYEGFHVPDRSIAAGRGNTLWAALFWAVFSMVVAMVVGYALQVGPRRFFTDMGRLPALLRTMVVGDGTGGPAHLLWGVAAGLLLAIVLPPSTGAIAGIGLFVAIPSTLGRILTAPITKLLGRVQSKATGTAQAAASRSGLIGSGLALLVAYILPNALWKLALAVVVGAAAFVLGQQRRNRDVAVAAVIVLVLGMIVVLATAHPAAADDGGFSECGSSWSQWLRNCPGASRVFAQAFGGAIPAALLAPLGLILGRLGLKPSDFEGLEPEAALEPAPPTQETGGDQGDDGKKDDEEPGVIHRFVASPRSCNACRGHSAHRCYRSASAAAGDRAHPHCHCALIRQKVDNETWQSYFADGAVVYDDRGG